MEKLRFLLRFCLALSLVTLAAAPAFAGATIGFIPGYNGYVTPYFNNGYCNGNNVVICNKSVWVQAGNLGATASLTVPSPYVHQPFAARCVNINGVLSYQIVDAANVTCALQICPASGMTLCGMQVPVPGGTTVGNTIEVQVPGAMLVNPSTSTKPIFTAQCVDSGGDTPIYQATDQSQVSCNLFPCPDSAVRLCDTQIHIPGGTPMGGLLHGTMPPPFTPDEFTLECVGSNGNAPTYQVMDNREVSCRKAQ